MHRWLVTLKWHFDVIHAPFVTVISLRILCGVQNHLCPIYICHLDTYVTPLTYFNMDFSKYDCQDLAWIHGTLMLSMNVDKLTRVSQSGSNRIDPQINFTSRRDFLPCYESNGTLWEPLEIWQLESVSPPHKTYAVSSYHICLYVAFSKIYGQGFAVLFCCCCCCCCCG